LPCILPPSSGQSVVVSISPRRDKAFIHLVTAQVRGANSEVGNFSITKIWTKVPTLPRKVTNAPPTWMSPLVPFVETQRPAHPCRNAAENDEKSNGQCNTAPVLQVSNPDADAKEEQRMSAFLPRVSQPPVPKIKTRRNPPP
jgi:hypothetical protein